METAPGLLREADGLHQQRHLAEAIALYRRAVDLQPDLAEAWYGLGCASLAAKAHADAAAALGKAVALRPDAPGPRCNLAEALFQLGELDAAVAQYQHAAVSDDVEARAVGLAGIACIAPGAPGLDNAAILAARRRWLSWQGRGVRRLVPQSLQPGRKLRIGYLGAFFGERNWMKMYMGVINAHDRGRFEFHFLADNAPPSAACGYADHDEDRIWDITGLANAELAQHIVAAGLDVLVDLNGYSYQRRLPLFLYRPARLQICWNGMYGTTGLPELDLLVGDAAVIPPEEERFLAEPVARVPGTYLPFQVFYPVPDVAPPPCLASGQLTFGSFSSAYKLTEPTVAAYAAILRGAPAARLLLRSRPLAEPSNRAAMLARFARHGIGAERLQLDGGAEHFEFLRAYGQMDVALDTFPYNGGTTTAESLWQGVPMLTCNGDRWAGRTSRSLLLAAGLAEWVPPDLQGFVASAIRLAHDPATPDRLSALRSGMRRQLAASAACDTGTVCRALEQLYLRAEQPGG